MKKSFFVIMAAFTLFSCGEKAYVSDLKTRLSMSSTIR